MREELDAVERNPTWEFVDLPKSKLSIGSRWVFKTKLRPDGTVDRYKTRPVLKGYAQATAVWDRL
jgi:hypothetical protein